MLIAYIAIHFSEMFVVVVFFLHNAVLEKKEQTQNVT